MTARFIVIGAGIAGLEASRILATKNHQVILLEARNRLGGRVYTTQASDGQTPIELGASFWEGKNENPFYQKYLSGGPYTQRLNETKSLIYTLDPHPKKQDPRTLFSYYQLAQQILLEMLPHSKGKTIAKMLEEINLSSLPFEKAYWIKKWSGYLLQHHCTPLDSVGLPFFHIPNDLNHNESWNDHDANFCFVTHGYDRVIQQMAKECLDAGVEIHLQTPVKKVNNHPSRVVVETENTFYEADKVICTLPLGVLKEVANHFFSPHLSQEKLTAINTMGVHDATRVVLEFEMPLWEVDAPMIFLDFHPEGKLIEFRNGYPLHGKAILITDSYSDVASKKTEVLVVEKIMKDLRKIYPNLPLPKYTRVQRWTKDPYAKGSYPYRTVGMNEAMHEALERPEGNIYFAGADYSRHGFSVHNAYASGRLVALQL